MIAGDEEQEIYFTNVIFDGRLYTLTYKWPGIEPPPDNPGKPPHCSCVGQFTLNVLNECLAKSRYAGAEILEGAEPRSVNHFRIGVVLELVPPPNPLRTPIMMGDFYVDQEDPTKFWQVLHFGYQNLYDPALDEWIVMDKFENTPGVVTLPEECKTVECPSVPLTADNCK